jgi:hypothetical protein
MPTYDEISTICERIRILEEKLRLQDPAAYAEFIKKRTVFERTYILERRIQEWLKIQENTLPTLNGNYKGLTQMDDLLKNIQYILKHKSNISITSEKEVNGITMIFFNLKKLSVGLSKSQIIINGEIFNFVDLVKIQSIYEHYVNQLVFLFMQTKTSSRKQAELNKFIQFAPTNKRLK